MTTITQLLRLRSLIGHGVFTLYLLCVAAAALAAQDQQVALAQGDAAGPGSAAAAGELRNFASPVLRQRYYALLDELRCPKCQNQNLADSDAPIASDLRNELFRLLHENKSDAEIKQYMVARFGTFVLYSPPASVYTAVLWLLPVALLLLCALMIWRISVRSGQNLQAGAGQHRAGQDNPDA